MRHVRLAVAVAGNEAAFVDLHARALAVELLAVRERSRSRTPRAIRRRARPSSQSTNTLSPSRPTAMARRALQELHAAPEELVLEHGRDLRVLVGQHLLAGHDERDLRAERAEHVGELDAGDARSDHDEVLGDLGRRVRLAASSRMRSPSSVAHSGTRGREPVDSRIASASISSTPSSVTAATVRATDEPPGAADEAHTLRLEQARRRRRAACSRCRRCARAARRRRARRARRAPSCGRGRAR